MAVQSPPHFRQISSAVATSSSGGSPSPTAEARTAASPEDGNSVVRQRSSRSSRARSVRIPPALQRFHPLLELADFQAAQRRLRQVSERPVAGDGVLQLQGIRDRDLHQAADLRRAVEPCTRSAPLTVASRRRRSRPSRRASWASTWVSGARQKQCGPSRSGGAWQGVPSACWARQADGISHLQPPLLARGLVTSALTMSPSCAVSAPHESRRPQAPARG